MGVQIIRIYQRWWSLFAFRISSTSVDMRPIAKLGTGILRVADDNVSLGGGQTFCLSYELYGKYKLYNIVLCC